MGARRRRADRDQPGGLPAARVRVGRPDLRGRHPRRDRQPARRRGRGDPDRPRREPRRRRLDAAGGAARRLPAAHPHAALPAERALRAARRPRDAQPAARASCSPSSRRSRSCRTSRPRPASRTFYLVYMYFLFFWIAQSTSWNILSGYTGYFSFGQGAFYGLGVYTAGDLFGREGWNYFLTIPIAGLLGGAPRGGGRGARVPPRLAARRDLRAAHAGGDVHALVDRRAQHVGRRRPGRSRSRSRSTRTSSASSRTWCTASASASPRWRSSSAFLIQNSRFGWGLFSIRDEEGVAEELGVPTFRYKMLAIIDLRLPRRASRARSRRCRSAT